MLSFFFGGSPDPKNLASVCISAASKVIAQNIPQKIQRRRAPTNTNTLYSPEDIIEFDRKQTELKIQLIEMKEEEEKKQEEEEKKKKEEELALEKQQREKERETQKRQKIDEKNWQLIESE